MKNIFLLSLCILLAGCETYNQDDYQEMVVIESYAVANRPLPVIHVTTTLPADAEYNKEAAGLTNAVVQVSLLDDNGNEEETFQYIASGSEPGAYWPQLPAHTVIPERTYRLDVQFNDRPEQLRAYTTIPEEFTIVNDVRDTVVYQSDEQLELEISPLQRQESQITFEINVTAQNPTLDNLTPFYSTSVEDEDSDIEIEDFFNNSSGLINEENFDIRQDGTISMKFPWIGVAFFGDNLVVTNSVDKNLRDLVRSQEIQLGGSTLPPGEIPNVRYNVEGGIGVFGSLSSDTVETYFKDPFPE